MSSDDDQSVFPLHPRRSVAAAAGEERVVDLEDARRRRDEAERAKLFGQIIRLADHLKK